MLRSATPVVATLFLVALAWLLQEPCGGAAPLLQRSSLQQRCDIAARVDDAPDEAVDNAVTAPGAERTAMPRPPSATVCVRGRVTNVDGQPIPSCVVASGGVRATSDGRGRFSLAGLPPGEHWLSAQKKGLAQLPTPPIRAQTGEHVDVLVQMQPAHFLRGRVMSSHRGPLAGARVEVKMNRCDQQPDWRRATGLGSSRQVLATQTDARGAFRIGPLFRGQCTLEVSHPAHAGFGRSVSTEESELVVTLPELGRVRGRVVEAQTGAAAPIDWLSVLVSRGDGQGPWQTLDPTAWHAAGGLDSGSFLVHTRTRRYLKVVVHGDDFAPTASAPFRVQPGKEQAPLLLRAQPGVPVQGQLLDENDRPLPGGEITVLEAEEKRGRGRLVTVAHVRSGSDGAFTTTPLAPGRYELRTRSPGHLERTVRIVLVSSVEPAAHVRIVMRAAGGLRGVVVARADGVLPRLWITATRLDASGRPTRTLEIRQCRFEFHELEPGSYQLDLRGRDVTAPVRHPPLATARAEVRPGASTSISLDLRGAGSSLSGRLLRHGLPRPGAEVVLEHEDRRLSWHCITDAQGRFRFASLRKGSYRLRHPSSRVVREVQVDGPSGGLTCDLDFTTAIPR